MLIKFVFCAQDEDHFESSLKIVKISNVFNPGCVGKRKRNG